MSVIANTMKKDKQFLQGCYMSSGDILLPKVFLPGGRRTGPLAGTWGAASASATYHYYKVNKGKMSYQIVVQNYKHCSPKVEKSVSVSGLKGPIRTFF